jgi:hypothetical protein
VNERLSIARIAEIQQRAEAATPGPWSTHEDWPGRVFSDGNPNYLHIARTTGWNAEANERFIAHAREDVPALLAELSTVRAELRVARGRVAELEALKPAPIQTCRTCGAGYTYGQPCSTCEFQAQMALAQQQSDRTARES